MNKNTTILLGAIAVLAIGVGAYVSMSSSTNEGFTTQSVRKSQTQSTKTVTDWGNEDGWNGDDVSWITIKYISGGGCFVTFDNWVTQYWHAGENWGGTCCKPEGSTVCYNWREPWVSGVEYGDQPVKEEAILDGNLD